MKLLLVSATTTEIQPFAHYHKNVVTHTEVNRHSLKFVTAGVGMVATAFELGKLFATEQFDLALQMGIAGAFDRTLSIGEVVNVQKDQFAELGAEDGEAFISIDELGFGRSTYFPSFNSPLPALSQVNAITVNKVQGNDTSIRSTMSRLNPQIESMEGAAFFYACKQANIPCMQLRSISNYVERRNRESWNIPLAIKNLNSTVIEVIEKL